MNADRSVDFFGSAVLSPHTARLYFCDQLFLPHLLPRHACTYCTWPFSPSLYLLTPSSTHLSTVIILLFWNNHTEINHHGIPHSLCYILYLHRHAKVATYPDKTGQISECSTGPFRELKTEGNKDVLLCLEALAKPLPSDASMCRGDWDKKERWKKTLRGTKCSKIIRKATKDVLLGYNISTFCYVKNNISVSFLGHYVIFFFKRVKTYFPSTHHVLLCCS